MDEKAQYTMVTFIDKVLKKILTEEQKKDGFIIFSQKLQNLIKEMTKYI